MTIDEIRDAIVAALHSHSHSELLSVLDDTTPGHYGVDEVEFVVDPNDISVDLRKREFLFRKARLNFEARLGASSDADGADMKFSKAITGSGKFEFRPASSEVDVSEFKINEDLDLFEPDE